MPNLLSDPVVSSEATQLFEDAQATLADIIQHQRLRCCGVIGLYAANSIEHDRTEVYSDESRQQVLVTLDHLRQQVDRQLERPYHSLADFVAPKDCGILDYMGAFAVSCLGAEALAAHYEAQQDDYQAIMVKALADRFAEAFAELMHQRVHKEFWGGMTEAKDFDNEALIKEAYRAFAQHRGIRHALNTVRKRRYGHDWTLKNRLEVN